MDMQGEYVSGFAAIELAYTVLQKLYLEELSNGRDRKDIIEAQVALQNLAASEWSAELK